MSVLTEGRGSPADEYKMCIQVSGRMLLGRRGEDGDGDGDVSARDKRSCRQPCESSRARHESYTQPHRAWRCGSHTSELWGVGECVLIG